MSGTPSGTDRYAAPPTSALPDSDASVLRMLDEVYGPLLAEYASALADDDLDVLTELNHRLDVALAALRMPSFLAGSGAAGTECRRAQDAAEAMSRLADLWREIAGAHVQAARAAGRPARDVSGTSTSGPPSRCAAAATRAGSSPWSCP